MDILTGSVPLDKLPPPRRYAVRVFLCSAGDGKHGKSVVCSCSVVLTMLVRIKYCYKLHPDNDKESKIITINRAFQKNVPVRLLGTRFTMQFLASNLVPRSGTGTFLQYEN
jgi:hypothetical protein